MVKLRELIHDIGIAEKQMYHLESKYCVLSHEFYRAFISGELSEFDAHDEYRMDFLQCAALYQTQQKLEQEYQRFSVRQPAAIHLRLQRATV